MTYSCKYICVSVLANLLLLSGCVDRESEPLLPPPSPPPSAPSSGTVIAVDDLKKGYCANSLNQSRLLDDVTVRDCNEPHEFEVAGFIARTEDMTAEFPGRTDLISKAQTECETIFEQHAGTVFWDVGELDLDTITPSANTWAEGDRNVICLIVTVNGDPLTQPASSY